ncbi:dolichyl-phosphate beta-glucosyltransferase [Bacillus rossius redtenbacheri]|uniref:dolichyl-phosphate beta-glucosyltransferase n=1 Tax=Bacillus rossius redtenbacheri TaxID=93214 RepID=UPI002FDE50F2
MMLDLCTFLCGVSCVSLLLFILLCVVLAKGTAPYPLVQRASEERYFINTAAGNARVDFPSLDDEHSVHLSVVVPAFDEKTRLPPMLDQCLDFLSARRPAGFLFEVIVVSDGSRDSTASVARKYTARWGPETVRVLELATNRGKGGAVRLGMMSARGAVLLFADADGATQFCDLAKLEASLKQLVQADYAAAPGDVAQRLGIVCGSRAHLEKEAIASRSLFRTVLMLGFHALVWLLAVRSVRDTQCGFKLLTRRAARVCFSSLHVERWAFDVELLYIAERLGIPVAEVAVTWTEIEGSKVVPVWSWLQMGRDLVLIWLRYRLGAWRLKPAGKAE